MDIAVWWSPTLMLYVITGGCRGQLGINIAGVGLSSLSYVNETRARFSLLLRVSSGSVRPITGQVTSVTSPVIGWAYSEQETGKA